MRIIAGKLKGRRLKSFKASHLRPTTDQVKEVIFNKLMMHISGARFLDLFSGTGNLSIEAYSRGASFIQAVEKNPKSVGIIKSNLTEFKILDAIKVLQMDVFKFLKREVESPFDIILIDPPFTQKLADKVMQEVGQTKLFHPETLVFIESTKHEDIQDEYGGLCLKERKNYGDKLLSIYTGV